ncbi:hypothetical protein BCU39_008395 [Vibrio cyclitrophicus]|uniref:hypothetical protein n=1 Tax=Vibrio cyclitrophicus TaxID=47951 RepID=UPI000C86537E|nr:hypothetical protein [Vibrio cyclitrophicus]PMI70275.1 hypothetical protein BCU39_04935 [Vibrio cyclitrophicus]
MNIELPNGVIIEGVPEGASRDEIKDKAIRNGLATAQDFPDYQAPATGRWANLASDPIGNSQDWGGTPEVGTMEAAVGEGVAQGLTFGFADEALAGVRSAFGDETYVEARDDLRNNMAITREESPWAFAGGEFLGGASTAARLPYAVWKGGASTMSNLAKLAGEGAAYGGLYGVGTSEGETLDDIARDATKSAAIGGVVSPMLGSAMRGLSNVFTPDTRSVNTNRAFGIEPTLSERYPAVGKVQDFLDTTSGGAMAAKRRSDQYVGDATQALKNLDDGFGDAHSIGTILTSAKNDWQEANQIIFNQSFSEIRNSVDMNGKVTPANTLGFLSSERAAYGGADDIANIVEIPSIKRLRKALEGGEDVSLDTLWKLRQELGDSITTGKFGVDDISQAKAKQLYANVSEDLYSGVFRHSDDLTAARFVELNEEYKDFQNTLDAIRPIFAKSNREQHSPEKVTAELVKRFRDEPSTLEPLRQITSEFGGSEMDGAAGGILYQTSLNRGEVDPAKALERYNISRSKGRNTDADEIYDDAFTIGGALRNESPSRVLSDVNINDYETAIQLARRAEEAVKRGRSTDPAQLVTSGAIPALAGFAGGGAVGAAATTGLYNLATYYTRRGLSSERVAARLEPLITGLKDGTVTPEALRIFNAMMASDSGLLSEM